MENQDRFPLAKYIDHTLLKPIILPQDLEALCSEAIDFGFCSVCIPPFLVSDAARFLNGSAVSVCTVAGFPFGFENIQSKGESMIRSFGNGAVEVDYVINISSLKNRNIEFLKQEIDELTTVAAIKGIILKAIIETCYLSLEEIKIICNLCVSGGVHFVKTSTGYGSAGAEIDHVKWMKEIVKDRAKIKASGGIKSLTSMEAMIAAGADRIGTSSGVAIMKESLNHFNLKYKHNE